jgi:hypothetical protein
VSKGSVAKEREAAAATARDLPDDVLEAEMKRRSAGNQRIEELLEFLRVGPEGYKHYGDDLRFGAEDLIEYLRRNWHQCVVSGVVEFKDIEGWLRRAIFGKTDGTKTTMKRAK